MRRTTRWAAVLGAGILSTLLATGVAITVSSDSTQLPILPQFGAYVGVANAAGLSSLGKFLGEDPHFASDYFDDASWSGIDHDTWLLDKWKGRGYAMQFGVPLLPTGDGVSLSAGARGLYNAHFLTLAHQLVAAGLANATLRLGWEFNQPAYPWYAAGHATAFVDYWRQVVTTMRSVSGQHFQFEWNVDMGDDGAKDRAMGNFDSYYPGPAYVDVIGMDVYDTAYEAYPGPAQEIASVLDRPWGLEWLAAFSTRAGKPMALPEFGLGPVPVSAPSENGRQPGEVSGGDDPQFITAVVRWSEQHNLITFVYWDYGRAALAENPKSAEALKVALVAPVAQGPPGAPGGSSPAGA